MHTIFKKIRKKIIAENKSIIVNTNYFKYALGEIVLVVIGILIALQVNSWNQNRIEKKDFDFSVNEFYKQMQIDVLQYNSIIDRYTFQVTKMDSIIDGRVAQINPKHLPGIIQLFDDNGNNLFDTDDEWQKNFLKLKPGDEKQNDMVRIIKKYYRDQFNSKKVLRSANMDDLMLNYLRTWNIPVRFLGEGDSYTYFISDYSPDFYSKDDLERVKKLIVDASFIADLKSLRDLKKKVMYYSRNLSTSGQAGLDRLKQVYPTIDFGINTMEIIGSATPKHDWASGYPMKKTADNTWEITLDLTDGAIKFRTDGAWTFDWGQAQSNPDKLVFKGGNIYVKKGKYHIIFDSKLITMELIRIDS